jgi:hypothetical protein
MGVLADKVLLDNAHKESLFDEHDYVTLEVANFAIAVAAEEAKIQELRDERGLNNTADQMVQRLTERIEIFNTKQRALFEKKM